MCGISGIYDPDKKVSNNEAENMDAAIAHRGPDASGTYQWNNYTLFHRRLSIIDLSDRGRQPMVDAAHKTAISYNGEIYNYLEIRSELKKKGYTFESDTDTEVVLKSYLAYGEEFVNKLDGMFALAILDGRQDKLLLARDGFGKKPLYYATGNNFFAFASEIKALKDLKPVDTSIDHESLALYFMLRFIPAPLTIYKGIKKLPPGTLAVFNGKDIKSVKKFGPLYIETKAENNKVDVKYTEQLLVESVKKRLEASDVPVGLFLSGGLDSSLLAALVKEAGIKNIKTFSIGFSDPTFDESIYAKEISKIFGTQHTSIYMDDCSPELLDKVVYHLDEPLGDPAAVPTFVLSENASKEVKVVLSGEGADEMFGGYIYYPLELIKESLDLRGKPGAAVLKGLSAGAEILLSGRRSMKTAWAWRSKPELGVVRWRVVNPPPLLTKIFSKDFLREINLEKILNILTTEKDKYTNRFSTDIRYWLAENLLMKVDKTTMAHGLEARAPYLDDNLYHYLSSIKPKKKFGSPFMLKKYLRIVASSKLPKTIYRRRKHGFMNPVKRWMDTSLKQNREKLLNNCDKTIFDVSAVKTYLHEDPDTAWLLMIYHTWQEVQNRN